MYRRHKSTALRHPATHLSDEVQRVSGWDDGGQPIEKAYVVDRGVVARHIGLEHELRGGRSSHDLSNGHLRATVALRYATFSDMGRFRPYSSQPNGMRVIGHCRKRSFFSLSTTGCDFLGASLAEECREGRVTDCVPRVLSPRWRRGCASSEQDRHENRSPLKSPDLGFLATIATPLVAFD